ncbi:nucleotidyltransferase domain-containing protein [Alkalicoccobacillus gibsonii]|uniref:nucleotidyltransferase domain-containing protein n=1 Tax=Alkalicoccobacillus gibsonii TaxID=79881 RepID=UPI001FE3B5FA
MRGGWAIDFLLGRITRRHSDIDIVTWIENRENVEWELVNAGYEQLPVKEQFRRRQSDFCKNNIEITLSYLTYNGGGSLILNGLPQWVWRADSLLLNDYLLDGVYAKVIHPKQLLEEKKTYQRIGRPYRKKDAESKKVLKEIISKFS